MTSKANAWLIGLGNGRWLARCGDQASGPCSLTLAKTEAMQMFKGAAGDYLVGNAITHLNGLQARLVDMEDGQ